MDIRNFFSAGSARPKPAESKKESTSAAKPETKAKKPEGKKTLVSKQKTKHREDSIADNIIIDDSSDEDVIKSSLTSTSDSKPSRSKDKNGKNEPKGNDSKKETSKSKKQAQQELVSKKHESKKEVETKHQNGSHTKREKKKENDGKSEQSKHLSASSDSKAKSSKSESQSTETGISSGLRTSPRKQKSVAELKTYSKTDSKLKKKPHKEISDSDNDVDIVEASSDEESPVGKNKRKGKSSSMKRKSNIFESDSDEDPLPQEKPKAKRKKNSRNFVPDSDDEKTETALDKFIIHKKSTPNSVKEKKTEVEKSTPINPADFFGSGSASVSRKERPMASARRKLEEKIEKEEVETDLLFDQEMHDDEEFLKTLDQLDGPEIKKVKPNETSPKKGGGGSLASKLAEKVRSSKDVSPTKKSMTPPKGQTTVKKGKTYTMEVTKPNTSTKSKDVGESETKVEATPPPKTQKKTPPPKTSAKKDGDKEDDGFGLKSSSSFRAFKMRGGPLALGSKEIPEGEENCLEGMTFVVTGVLDSIERDDAKSLVEKLGGKMTTSISKKTNYVVVGREPGESKLKKANELKVKTLDEDGLFDLIRTLPGKTSKYEVKAKEQLKKEESVKEETARATASKKLESFRLDKGKGKGKDEDVSHFTQLKNSGTAAKIDKGSSSSSEMKTDNSRTTTIEPETLLWVDKHKPTSLKQIIGQHGDKSNANKLLHWIQHWHQNVIVKGMKPPGNFFGGGKGDGGGFRAALLSGPPGIGKTTTATLVCKEAGFSYVELNASDTRSKRNLKEVVAESLNNQTLLDYMGDSKASLQGQRHCVIMDEVDGMAGNEDRGGLQELVQLIKASKIPIICICNDRNSMKMRTLANYCFDLRFSRPRVEQIKGAMLTLAFREGLKIPPAAVQEIILSSNHDIRQVIHNLSMWSAGDKQLTYDQVKKDAQKAQKDVKMGPFDVCRKVFVLDEETSKMSLLDKSDLFFHDYSFGPLFVHENYPHIIPAAAKADKKRHMACLARTIDSLCDGDLVERRIRKEGNWNLLPVQAMYSSVIPGEYMRGKFPQMTDFPSWLGKNSSRGKTDRILQELNRHMHLQISCDKRGLALDYLPAMRVRLAHPLLEQGSEGVPSVIEMLDDYDIVKDDFDNIMEVTKWPHCADPLAKLETKTKAAFTRQYNKGSHLTPYTTGAASKKKKGKASAVEDDLLVAPGDEPPVVEESEEEDDEPVLVAKPKSSAGKGKQASGKGKQPSSKGNKGKGSK